MDALVNGKPSIYLGKGEKMSFIASILLWDSLTSWVKDSKVLSDTERKSLTEAAKNIEETCHSLLGRTNKNMADKIYDEISQSTFIVENVENTKLDGKIGYRNVLMDDIDELADCALDKCIGCDNCDFENCKRFQLFVKLLIPASQSETPFCPYRN